MYSFLFDRKSLTLLVTAAGVAGLLLFAAGVLVGVRINLPTPATSTAEFQSLSTFEGGLVKSAGAEPASPPTGNIEPAPEPGTFAAQPAAAQPRPEPEPIPAPPAAVPPPPAPVAPPVEPVVAEPPPAPVPEVVEPATAPAPSMTEPLPMKSPEPPIEVEPEPSPVRSPADSLAARVKEALRAQGGEPSPSLDGTPQSDSRQGGYYVQVGAYGLAENAERELAIVLAEGFDGYVVPLSSTSRGGLSAVRFGGYSRRTAALADAKKYLAGAPGRDVIVRPPE